MTLRVLLFSPVSGRDPASGDLAYTEALLTDPPRGVRYTSYADALDAGLVRIRGRRPTHGDFSATDAVIALARAGEHVLRRTAVMYREPAWFITVDESAFDVVHQHLFAIRQIGSRVPAVSTAGYPLGLLYASRDGWSSARVNLANVLEYSYARLLDIHNPWLRRSAGNLMTVYTQHFRDHVISQGADPNHLEVISTALPELELPPRRSNGMTLGFIGRDFELKGGDIAVEAFIELRKHHPELRLRLITSSQSVELHNLVGAESDGIELFADVPHQAVIHDHLPEIDILLHPTRADCGAPYSLLEALRSGVFVVTSQFPWLDERLTPPAVARVPVDGASVAAAVARVLDHGLLNDAQLAAQELWAKEFSMRVIHRQLLRAYGRVAVGAPPGLD